jgi:type IV pilus assembly protein PilB
MSRPHGEQAIALEDPVLVRMPGVTQVAVDRSAGLGTADALRASLRRVPDRLMVTDIPDAETARLAIQAAASGCLVLAGMNAPDVFCALARLADCGLPPFTLASALRLAASQRSLRRLCVNCRQPVTDGHAQLISAGCIESELAGATPYRAVGCSECRHGYRGRLHVYTTLRITGDLRQLVRSGAPVEEWRDKTLAWGFLTLRRTALRMALHGQTSLDEVLVSTPEDV